VDALRRAGVASIYCERETRSTVCLTVLTADWEIVHPDGRPYTMGEWPLVRSITSGETVVDEEYVNVLADGSRMIVRSNSSPIYDDDGRIVAGVLVMTDVTEQKRERRRGRPRQPADRRPDAHHHPDRAQPRREHPRQAGRPLAAPGVPVALRYGAIVR
jgi:hypothetical protein